MHDEFAPLSVIRLPGVLICSAMAPTIFLSLPISLFNVDTADCISPRIDANSLEKTACWFRIVPICFTRSGDVEDGMAGGGEE